MLCGNFLSCLNKLCAFLLSFIPCLEEEIWSMFRPAPTVICMRDPGSPWWWYYAVWWWRWWVATFMHIVLYLRSCGTALKWGTSVHSVHCFFGQNNTQTEEDGERSSVSHFGVFLTQANSARYWLALWTPAQYTVFTLDILAKQLQNVTVSFVISVLLHGTIWLPLDTLSWHNILLTFY